MYLHHLTVVNLTNNSSLEEAKYCLGGNFIGTGGGGLDIWDGINVSAYLNSTSPTGRTIQVSVPDLQDGIYIRFNITDLDDDGDSSDDWQYVHYSFGDYPDTSRVGMGLWQLPIPTHWDESEIDVYWKLSTTRGTEFAFTGMPVYIDGQAIDGNSFISTNSCFEFYSYFSGTYNCIWNIYCY